MSEVIQLVSDIAEMQTPQSGSIVSAQLPGYVGMCALTELTRTPGGAMLREAFWPKRTLSCIGSSDLFTETHVSPILDGTRKLG